MIRSAPRSERYKSCSDILPARSRVSSTCIRSRRIDEWRWKNWRRWFLDPNGPKFHGLKIWRSQNLLKAQRMLVGAIGFEPTTPCAQGRCATRLRYAPTLTAFLILNYFRELHCWQFHVLVFA